MNMYESMNEETLLKLKEETIQTLVDINYALDKPVEVINGNDTLLVTSSFHCKDKHSGYIFKKYGRRQNPHIYSRGKKLYLKDLYNKGLDNK